MRFDGIDFRMFEVMKNSEGKLTTSKIAKEIFSPQDDYEYRKKDSMVRKRLKKWEELGAVRSVKENNKSFYEIDTEVHIGDTSVVVTSEEEQAVMEVGKCMMIFVDNQWLVFEAEREPQPSSEPVNQKVPV